MWRFIIDSDPGNGFPGSDVDDALAIAIALLVPEVDLRGVTIVAGNVELPEALSAALTLMEVAGRRDVPVCAGAERPLVADPRPIRVAMNARRQDAARLWATVPLPCLQPPRDPRRAARFLVESIMEAPGEITLIAIGPLTNVATALLLEPQLAQAVREIIWMGGALRCPGNVTPVAEFNAFYDPEAAYIVFHSGAPLTLVPLDVTTRTCLTLSEIAQIRAIGTPITTYLAMITEPWVRYVMERRGLPGCWLHDPLAVCVALDPTIARREPWHVTIELTGQQSRGQTIGWDGKFPYLFPGGQPNVQVCVDLDTRRFMALLLTALGA